MRSDERVQPQVVEIRSWRPAHSNHARALKPHRLSTRTMLLHFDFKPTAPHWCEFQPALEQVARRSVSMTGGPSAGGGPDTWVAKLAGVPGTLVLNYQSEVTGGLVIHANEAHRDFVAPLVAAFEGTRRSHGTVVDGRKPRATWLVVASVVLDERISRTCGFPLN